MLRREVPIHSPAAARVLVAWLLVGSLIIVAVHEPRAVKVYGESKVDLTRMATKDYADTAFLMWRRNNPDEQCPTSLGVLNEYTNRKPKDGRPDISDSWGYDLRMTCDEHGLRVWSIGEDGRYDTADDIKSWE